MTSSNLSATCLTKLHNTNHDNTFPSLLKLDNLQKVISPLYRILSVFDGCLSMWVIHNTFQIVYQHEISPLLVERGGRSRV